MSIVIKGVRTLENKVVDVQVEGGRISGVGKSLKGGEVIDGKGKLVLPGLVNTHTHTGMSLLRGYAEDMDLQEWLETKVWPIEAAMGPEEGKIGAELSCLEMIKSGTTAFADMYIFSDLTVPEVVARAGLRGFISYGMVDLGDEKRIESEVRDSEKFVKGVLGMKNPKVVPTYGPHGVYTASEETLRQVRELATRRKVGVQIHVSETRKEVYDCKKKTGKRPVEFLDSLGFLGKDVLLAHCVWITKGEIGMIAKSGANVSHNPVSNLKLASGGLCPLPELQEAGVTVGLGTDGPTSNNSLDMFEEMKFASLLQKNSHWDPKVIPAEAALSLGTIGGASCFGLDYGIREGCVADLVLVDLKGAHLRPSHNPASIVYSARGSDVDTVIVGGDMLMVERKVLTLDEERILERAQEVGLRLIGENEGKLKKTRKI